MNFWQYLNDKADKESKIHRIQQCQHSTSDSFPENTINLYINDQHIHSNEKKMIISSHGSNALDQYLKQKNKCSTKALDSILWNDLHIERKTSK